MPAKSQRPAPASSIDGRTVGALSILVVIVVAVVAALSVGLGGAPSGSGPLSSDASLAPGSSDALPSDTPASAVLEGLLPTTVNGTTVTVRSATDAKSIASDPSGRALDAAVLAMGKQPTDLEIGVAYDASQSVDLTIIAFRVAGVSADKLQPLVLHTWLANQTAGVTTTKANLSGNAVTHVSYGDSGADEYLFVFHDAVFVVETADQALATAAVAAVTGVSASPPPSGSTPPAASPGPSGSTVPSPS